MATTLLSLADARIHLNISTITHDAELQTFIDAAARVIESRVGPIDTATHTQTFSRGEGNVLALGHAQVTAVTALTLVRDGSSPITLAGLVIDAVTGIIRSKTQLFPVEPFKVTYTVGRTPIPENLVMACKIIVQNMWDTQNARRRNDDDLLPGTTYLIPYRAEALIKATDNIGGFA